MCLPAFALGHGPGTAIGMSAKTLHWRLMFDTDSVSVEKKLGHLALPHTTGRHEYQCTLEEAFPHATTFGSLPASTHAALPAASNPSPPPPSRLGSL